MKTFHLIVSSPDGNIFEDEIVMLSVRGIDGELAVMAGHIPFVTTLLPSVCTIEFEDLDKEPLKAKIESGLLTVASDRTTILTGSFNLIKN